MYQPNVMLSGGIVFCGLQYNKVMRLFECLGMSVVSPRAHTNYLKKVVYPCVRFAFVTYQGMIRVALIQRQKDTGVGATLVGDMQFASVGKSIFSNCLFTYNWTIAFILGNNSTYGQYTNLDFESGNTVTNKSLDKRETDMKSVTMELYGHQRGLYELAEDGVEIYATVNDEHVQVIL